MGNSDSPTTIPLCFGCPSARRYRAVDQRPHRRRRGLSGSWGTSGRALRSQTPAGPLRLALEDDCRCGELLFPAALATRAGASILTMVAVSPPRGASMLPPRTCTAAAPTTTFFRSSITRLAASLSVFPDIARNTTGGRGGIVAVRLPPSPARWSEAFVGDAIRARIVGHAVHARPFMTSRCDSTEPHFSSSSG
jgi:hypothetical protein